MKHNKLFLLLSLVSAALYADGAVTVTAEPNTGKVTMTMQGRILSGMFRGGGPSATYTPE